jgi:NDP-sugar pyrophosphorylase family protein
MLNIVIPSAGEGSRFQKVGFTTPKPFIDVAGKAMIERVLDNLASDDVRFILYMREAHMHAERERMEDIRERYNPVVIPVEALTEGMVSTILLGREYIEGDDPVVIGACDQLVDVPLKDMMRDADERGLDGSLMTFYATHPKWSYCRLGEDGYVDMVREKEPISTHANVGIYYYRRGRDFVKSADTMITRGEKSNNEYYAAPTYNYLIEDGGRVGIFEIDESDMHGLGTPEDLELFLKKNNFEKE